MKKNTNQDQETININTNSAGLIRGRHEMPCAQYIFNSAIENVHDYSAIYTHIMGWLRENVGTHNVETYNGNVVVGNKPLLVYVTGLTPVTVELIRACFAMGIDLTLMNYDTATGAYVPQQFNAHNMVLNLCY